MKGENDFRPTVAAPARIFHSRKVRQGRKGIQGRYILIKEGNAHAKDANPTLLSLGKPR